MEYGNKLDLAHWWYEYFIFYENISICYNILLVHWYTLYGKTSTFNLLIYFNFIFMKNFKTLNPLPNMPNLGSSNSAANKDMM